MGGHGLVMRDEPGRLEEATFRAFVPEQSIREAKGGGLFGRMPESMLRASWKARLARIRAARGRGVGLRAGTDSLMTGTFFGPSLHWELEHFVEAGLSPRDSRVLHVSVPVVYFSGRAQLRVPPQDRLAGTASWTTSLASAA
jgi:hypothetical protein